MHVPRRSATNVEEYGSVIATLQSLLREVHMEPPLVFAPVPRYEPQTWGTLDYPPGTQTGETLDICWSLTKLHTANLDP